MNQRELKINDLTLKGLLTPKAVCDSNAIKLLYGSIEEGEGINFLLDDITCNNIVYYYLEWRGEKCVKRCEECNIPYNSKNNKSKYCNKCAKKILQEQKNKWKREKWNKEEK